MKIAENYDKFVETVVGAEVSMLNDSEVGRKLVDDLLRLKLEQNPSMTKEEWNRTKQQFLVFLFAMMMKEKPELMNEFGSHFWNKVGGEL